MDSFEESRLLQQPLERSHSLGGENRPRVIYTVVIVNVRRARPRDFPSRLASSALDDCSQRAHYIDTDKSEWWRGTVAFIKLSSVRGRVSIGFHRD